jgi:phage terminase Nu1 subunit (DNA packaging protein)
MSFAAYARHRGVSRAAVNIAVKEGRITTVKGPDGKPCVDQTKADAQWEANSKQRAKAAVAEIESEVNAASEPQSYNEARTEKEVVQAKLLNLKYEELSGKLVDAEEVERTWSEIATKTKNKIIGAASKLKQRHPEISIEIYASLDSILREALEELANETDT